MTIKEKMQIEDYSDGYYHVSKDINNYPDAWCIVTWSKRGAGKTYGALKYCYANDIKFIYIKRTNEDVDFICTDYQKTGMDVSPFSPINRDCGCNVQAKRIDKGVGAFYEYDGDNIIGEPVGYILSLNAIKRVKGFNMDECTVMIFDEFIPQVGEVVKIKDGGEGSQLLDLYMTVLRDRVERGQKPLLLILFANAEQLSCPVVATLEIMDTIAEMKNKNIYYDENRGILLHHITEDDFPTKECAKVGIYKAMQGTKWFEKSFGGNFSNNDFSNVVNISLKNYRCFIGVKYNNHQYYIYYNDYKGTYYMTSSPGKPMYNYDLDKENDQKLFYSDFGINLRIALMEDRFKFKRYSMYDLIINYKKYFRF